MSAHRRRQYWKHTTKKNSTIKSARILVVHEIAITLASGIPLTSFRPKFSGAFIFSPFHDAQSTSEKEGAFYAHQDTGTKEANSAAEYERAYAKQAPKRKRKEKILQQAKSTSRWACKSLAV
jgi:hypothetical protein